MSDFYSKKSIQDFINFYIKYNDEICFPAQFGIDDSFESKYLDLFNYFMAPFNEEGEYDPSVSYTFIDMIFDHSIQSMVELGKMKEKVTNELPPFSDGMSEKDKAEILDTITMNITPIGKKMNAITNIISLLGSNIDMDVVLGSKTLTLRKEFARKMGMDENIVPNILFSQIKNEKMQQYRETLSEEDKRYFDIGSRVSVTVPAIDRLELTEEQKNYANNLKSENQDQEERNKFVTNNVFLKRHNQINDVIRNKRHNLVEMANNLNQINRLGHINSGKFNDIIDNSNKILTMLSDNLVDGNNSILNSEMNAIYKKKIRVAVINDLENSLVSYLEDKWKPRRTDMGAARFDAAFAMLEAIDPEKSKALRDYHSMQRELSGKVADSFDTYYKDIASRHARNEGWEIIDKNGKEIEQMSFKDIMREEGKINHFIPNEDFHDDKQDPSKDHISLLGV